MGVWGMSTGSSDSPKLGEPNKHNYKVTGVNKIGDFVIVCAVYPGCTEYDGRYRPGDIGICSHHNSVDPLNTWAIGFFHRRLTVR